MCAPREDRYLVIDTLVAVTLSSVHLQLAEQDTCDLEAGRDVSLHVEVTASILISMGLDLEHS